MATSNKYCHIQEKIVIMLHMNVHVHVHCFIILIFMKNIFYDLDQNKSNFCLCKFRKINYTQCKKFTDIIIVENRTSNNNEQ